MPTDQAGIPFQYATKIGGFFYEMEDDPENSNFADWPAEMSFPGDGTVVMEPQGATDFGLGKNIASFSDAIGGCNMSFADTVARGYMFKADDPRDLEIKCIAQFDGIQSGNDMSISSRSGHHTGDGCCQGFAYMFGYDCNTNQFRFRKEMWHVSYHESPEGSFSHSAVTADYNGGKKIGLGLTIYNKPGSNNTRVVLEGWCNPDPTANITNWIMVKRIEDFSGNGWGDDGGDCDGEDDQFGPWSGPQSRFKTNSSGGSITFEAVSMREIDPSRALDDTGGGTDPPTPPPPSPGGGGTQPATISPVITYAMVSANLDWISTSTTDIPLHGVNASGAVVDLNVLQSLVKQIVSQIIGAMVNADPHARFGPPGWSRNTTNNFDIHLSPCLSNSPPYNFKIYPDGLAVNTYWSNSTNICTATGLSNGTTGTDTDDVINHGGRIMKNPHIHLIFWGGGRTDWNARTETPTMNQIIAEVRDKLLGTDKQYFSGIQQYGAPGIPVWGTTGSGVSAHNIVIGDTPSPTDTFTPTLAYCAVSLITSKATAASVTNLQWTDMMLSEELIEAQTDTEGTAWYGDTLEDPTEEPIREIGDNPCDLDTGSFKGTYASGLSVMAYWSNAHNNCIIPGITATDVGDSTAISFHGGRVMKNPVLRLIFWGTEWTTQTSPTKAEVIAEVQNKLLVTNATFFSQLSQYSSCGTPTYGSAVQNTNVPYPTAGDHSSDRAAIEAVIKNSLDTALLPVTNSATMQNELYIVFLAKNKTITTDEGYSVDGYHKTLEVTFPS